MKIKVALNRYFFIVAIFCESMATSPFRSSMQSLVLSRPKTDRQIAAQIWIEEWPANEMQNAEKYFEEAAELPIDVPAPVAQEPQSVLSSATRHLSLIEIMNRQRKQDRS